MFLSKHKNGNYYIIYIKPNGKRGTRSTKTKLKSVAIKRLNKFRKQFEEEQDRDFTPVTLKNFTFSFLVRREAYYTEKTIKVYKSTFKYFLDYFGDIQLSDLTTFQIENYLHKRIQDTSIYAARKDLSNLSCAFNKAVRDGYLLHNPCKGIKRFRLPEKQPLFYSKEDFNKLLEAVDKEDLIDLIIVAVNTGMRQMELIKLEWSQVDMDSMIITLDNRSHITKSKKLRTIPINKNTGAILEKRLRNRSIDFPEVFMSDGRPFDQDRLSKSFKKYVYKAKINSKLNFHSLRHTFASWLVQAGVSIYVVSKLLGHADIKTTEIYAHLRSDDLRSATEKLNDEFE